MLTGKNMVIFGSVIVIAVVLQVALISVGKVESPAEAAVEFTKAYFMLDGPSMAELLCSELSEDQEADIVGGYLNYSAEKARSMAPLLSISNCSIGLASAPGGWTDISTSLLVLSLTCSANVFMVTNV